MRKNDPLKMRGLALDAAAREFHRSSFHAVSIERIKKDAGLTSGAFAHHFTSKKALALAVISERVAAAVDRAWLQPVREAEDAASGIRAAFGGVVAELVEANTIRGCPLNNLALELAGEDPDYRKMLHAIFDLWTDLIADKIRADQQRGRLCADVDADAFARLVVAGYSGAMTMAKVAGDHTPLEACADQLASLLRTHTIDAPASV